MLFFFVYFNPLIFEFIYKTNCILIAKRFPQAITRQNNKPLVRIKFF